VRISAGLKPATTSLLEYKKLNVLKEVIQKMKIIIKGKNIELTDNLRSYVEKKLSKLKKYFDRIIEIVVTLSVERNRQIVEATLKVSRVLIRAEEDTDDMYASIDKVVEKLERQIKKYKEKLFQKTYPERSEAVLSGKRVGISADNELLEIPKIVRAKKIAIKRMSPEEAAIQLDLLDYNFFTFVNDDTDKINIIYKRKGESLGLMVLEFSHPVQE